MPLVCYNKPNRKKVRHFTEKDVERIARYAIRDGANAFQILAGVSFAVGVGYMFCVAARAIDNMASLNRLILKVAGIMALGRFIDFVLTVMSSNVYTRLRKVRRFGLVLVILAAITEPILKGIKTLIDDAEILVSASSSVHKVCDRVKEYAIVAGETIDEKYNDAIDFLD